MMMVDPNYLRGLSASISQSGAAEQTLTTELSSGLRVAQLADDPVAAAANVGLASSIARLDSFVKSSTAEQSRMQVADSALGQVVSQVTSALSLAVSAGNGTLSGSDLASLKTQLVSLRDNVVALGNTSYQGHFVFSGSQGATKPFSIDGSTDPATVSYHGDGVVQTVETPDGQQVAVNLPGSSVLGTGAGGLLATINQLASDVTGGSSAAIAADTAALSAALGTVTTQRSVLDSGLSRMTMASGYASTQQTVYTAQQSALLSADPTTIATDLKTAEVHYQALLGVTSALEGQQNLFAYLK